MSLFRKQHQRFTGMTAEDYIRRIGWPNNGRAIVTTDTALRHSAVWACIRLRANLISTMPVDVYRKVGNIHVNLATPPVLKNPGGERVGIEEWIYDTQVDLDRAGNAIGLITERQGTGLPSRIDLQPVSECSVVPNPVTADTPDGFKYRICGKLYNPREVWHERQYTVSGLPVGLSPVAYAAWTIGEYLSIQDFVSDFFGQGGVPSTHLKNTAKVVTGPEAQEIKDRFKASVQQGGMFVSGMDWELNLLQSEAAGASWLDAKKYGISDVARFLDVPGDLIDAETVSRSVTYANVTQRNLQFLIMHLGPAVIRRERALSKLLASPRFVKLNSEALLRMDPQSRADMIKVQVDSRTITPDEGRELDNRPPLTDEQTDQFLTFWPPRNTKEEGASLEPVTVTPGASSGAEPASSG